MPRICFFRGIAVYVYFRDHAPPHVHVQYAGEWVLLEIATGRIYRGSIHPLALSLSRDWVKARRAELEEAWDAAAAGKEPKQVPPPGKGRRKGVKRSRFTEEE